MRGFRLVALSPKAEEAFKDKKVAREDKRVVVQVLNNKPLTVSFLFKKKIMRHVIKKESVIIWIMREFPLLKEGRDYNLEVVE